MEPTLLIVNDNTTIFPPEATLLEISNLDKWHCYCANLPSPENFITAGYLYIVAAALQRRVWLPPTNSPLYPNLYIIPTGDAGVGKGMLIKEVSKILRYHKMENPVVAVKASEVKPVQQYDKEGQTLVADANEVNFERAEAEENSYGVDVGGGKDKKKLSIEKPLCIPMAADDSTYEALVKALSKSIRYKDYPKWNPKSEKFEAGIYMHSSLAFCLEEISSIFKKNKDNVAKLFLNTYDCGDYTYDTKTQGKDRVKNCCLNFLGGTTPTFLEDVFSSQLLTDGFASRAWFIFENEGKDNGFFLKPWNETQMTYHKDILNHVGKLLTLYGELSYEDGVEEYLEEWWKENKDKRANKSTKLDSYYSRKKAHILKCATAHHFGQWTTMKIGLVSIKWAIEFLFKVEKKMHYALGFGDTNPLFKAGKKLLSYLKKNGKAKRPAMMMEIYSMLPKGKPDYEELIDFLVSTKQIVDTKEDTKLGTTEVWWSVVERAEELP